jgi:hypothetical protein
MEVFSTPEGKQLLFITLMLLAVILVVHLLPDSWTTDSSKRQRNNESDLL